MDSKKAESRAELAAAIDKADGTQVQLSRELSEQLLAALGPFAADGQPCAPERYRHYKGGHYELLCRATLEADHTPMLVYRAGNGTLWLRPEAVFFEEIEVEGRVQTRFSRIEADGGLSL